jgi:cytochrome c2
MKPEATWLVPLVSAALALVGGCGADAEAPPSIGDAERGRLLLRQFHCGSCHRIPGVVLAQGRDGPPLERLAERAYLAGTLPNTPEHLVRWITEPQGVKPGTAMPDLGVGEEHARDMAAYLYTLK